MEKDRSTSDEFNMAALAQLFGLVAALPIWLMWRGRSAFVRAHAVQSLLLDGLLFAVIVALMGLLAGGLLGSAALAGQPDASLLSLGLLALGLPLCSLAGMLAATTAMLVLRVRAGLAALQGRAYRYPLLSRWG